MTAVLQKKKYNVRDLFKLQRVEVESTNHCCVPLCSASGLYNSRLSFHRFPKNTSLRSRWLQKIRRAGLSVTPHTKVCSRHFPANEIHTTAKGRRVLAAGSVPSLFQWNNYTRKDHVDVWERRSRPSSPEPDCPGPVEDSGQPVIVPMVVDHDYGSSRTRRKDGTSSYYCCVLRCTASSNINSYLSFHTFPKDKEMQKMWLDNIRRDFKITNQTRVCSRHFLSADLVEPSGPTGRRCLKDNAVPVLFHWNNFSFTVPAPCTGDWDSNDSLMFGKYSDHDYCSTAEPADALHLSLDHIEHSYAEKTCLRNKTAENSITHNSRICSGRSPASNDFRATEIEIADHSPGSDVPTQLCKSEQTETCTDSEEMISSPLGDTTSADEVDEGLLKIIKVEECEDFANFGEGTSSFLKQDISEEQQTKEVKEEEPEHECLYCEKCKSFYINKCEFHGPAVFIPDTPVPAGVTGRARLTLPLGLEVRQSEIFEAGLGVFNKGETIPVGVNFGPYEGELVDRDEALNSGYSWVIYRSRQCNEYIDATKESQANWMRYVNCARNGEEQNLVAFQYRGGIYYRCRQPIEPRQELLVWYSEEYPRDHSLEFNCLWNKKASMNKIEDSLVQVVSCSWCHLSYPSQMDLQKHIRKSHCHENSPTKSSNIQQALSVDCCSDCGKSFTPPDDFQTHQCEKHHVHVQEKLHICSKCGKSFAFYSTLQKHQQNFHIGEKKHRCLQCGKRFTGLRNLQALRHVHAREQSYHCTHCGRRFSRQNQKRRRRTYQTHHHTYEAGKSHVCIRCGKSFPYASRLRVHKCIHAGEKPYICSKCEKSFASQSHLRAHQCVHARDKPHCCSQCGKSFSLKSTLQLHLRIHTTEKRFDCSQCRKSFRQQGHLQIHQCNYTDEKPYRCSDCGQRFPHASTLQTHECVNTVPSVTVVL